MGSHKAEESLWKSHKPCFLLKGQAIKSVLTQSPTGAAADDARQFHCWYRFKPIPCWSTDIYAIALAINYVDAG